MDLNVILGELQACHRELRTEIYFRSIIQSKQQIFSRYRNKKNFYESMLSNVFVESL